MKTKLKVDKFTVEAIADGKSLGLNQSKPAEFTASFVCCDTGRSFSLPVNKDFFESINGRSDKITMEIKIDS